MENPFQSIIDELKEINRKVSSMDTDIQNINNRVESHNNDDVLDFSGFCKFLKISTATGYKYTSTNTVPYFKKEGKLYFLKSRLLQWIESGKIKTKWELDEEAEKYISDKLYRR